MPYTLYIHERERHTCWVCCQPASRLYSFSLGLKALLFRRYACHLGHMLACASCYAHEVSLKGALCK